MSKLTATPLTADNALFEVENVSRRAFLKQFGIGSTALVLATTIPGFSPLLAAEVTRNGQLDKAQHALNFFVSIDTDGRTSIVCHRSEMGQGVKTSVPQIVAEELNADWQQVYAVQGQADHRYGPQGTAGSASIRKQYTKMRKVGAAARQMLEQAAANHWQVPVADVSAKEHFVINNASGDKLGFGELAKAASKLTPPADDAITLKHAKDFILIGKDVELFDQHDMIAGKAIYAQDIQLPDMLIASIARPPVIGGKVSSFDASEALKVRGVVKVIELKARSMPVSVLPLGGIAVLATNTWAAHEGKKRLKIEWQHGEHAVLNTETLQQQLIKTVSNKGDVARTKGDVYSHSYDQENTLEATYSMPYQNHSPMETPSATATVKGSGKDLTCTIWAGTQNPQWAQGLVATELGIKKEQVELNITLMGGAFGRKSKGDFIVEAVELARQVAKPVKVVWTREDDIKHGFYHSISANYLKAELSDEQGADFWIQRLANPPIGWLFDGKKKSLSTGDLSVGFGDTPFEMANMSLESHKADSHVRPGWVRGVAALNNSFALGSFVDELADKAGISTQQMWLKLIGSDRHVDLKKEGFDYGNYGSGFDTHPVDTKRMKACINHLCEQANTAQPQPKNQGWGIGFLRSFGSYVAAATKVNVENGKVTVLEMHCAIDCGVAITPDRVKAQMEGAMVFGLSIVLMGGITVKNGQVEQSNFHDAMVTRINQSPKMFVHIIESNEAPGGVGEPGVPPIIPSITNAIFKASGVRVRHLPVNKQLKV